jgi:putative addiction module component (TIGR02574 family)
MTQATAAILGEASRLSPIERAELIDALYQTFDGKPDERQELAWAAELESRIDAYDAGSLTAEDAETLFKRVGRQ